MAHPKTSRGALGWLAAVLAGGVSAATFSLALIFAASPLAVFAYLSAAPLFITGLGAGATSGIVAASLGVAALYSVLQSIFVVLAYFVLIGLPVTGLIIMAMRYRHGENGKIFWYPEGYLLTMLAIYPCIVFLATAIIIANQGDDLLSLSGQLLQNFTATFVQTLKPEAAAQFSDALNTVARALPVISGTGWMALIMVSAIVAQYTLRQQNWLLRAPLQLHDLQLPNWLIGALVTAGLCGTLGAKPLDYYGMNVSLLLCVPFFFVGLLVVHALAATVRHKRLTLFFFYFFVAVMPKVDALVFLAFLGVLDQGLNLRQRLAHQLKLT